METIRAVDGIDPQFAAAGERPIELTLTKREPVSSGSSRATLRKFMALNAQGSQRLEESTLTDQFKAESGSAEEMASVLLKYKNIFQAAKANDQHAVDLFLKLGGDIDDAIEGAIFVKSIPLKPKI